MESANAANPAFAGTAATNFDEECAERAFTGATSEEPFMGRRTSKTFSATLARREPRSGASRRRKATPPRAKYSPVFFVAMAAAVAGTIGFFSVVAALMVGG